MWYAEFMGKPKKEIKDKEYYKDIHFLYEILNLFKEVESIKIFFKDILTRSELRMLKRRWHIASLLSQGYDVRTTAVKSSTSTQTVSKIKSILENGNGGLRLAINKMNQKLEKQRQDYINSKKKSGGSKFVKGWFS